MDTLCSLIIIEDEDQIREGLALGVPWEELGFRLAGCYSSGEEALTFLKSHDVDAILSDICLGGLSGLDVAGWLHANRPSTKVVLVSGYSDFQYAQAAIRFQVSSYLLKPIDFRELRTLFTDLHAEIRKASSENRKLHSGDEYCLKSLLSLSLQGERIGSPLPLSPDLLQHAADQGWFLCRISHSAGDSSEKQGLDWDSFSPAPNRFCSAVIYRNPHAYLLALPLTEYSLSECAHDLESSLSYALEKLSRESGRSLSVTVFRSFRQFEEVQDYLSAVSSCGEPRDVPLLPAVIRDISVLNTEQIRLDFAKLDDESLRAACYVLLSKIILFEEQYAYESGDPVTDYDFRQISFETSASLRSHAERILNRFESLLSLNSSDIVEKACLYIQECKGRKTSLSEVSEHVFVSPSYLSKLFKKQKNMNFKAYVSSVSLEYAKNLLTNTEMKVMDISELLGFRDVRYFYKFFRDGTGKTPAEYRKHYRVKP